MAHDARAVANAVIQQARAGNRQLTPMQIIKLVYIAHGCMLGLLGRPLVRQPIEAWQYGPVINDLYQALKSYGSGYVDRELMWHTPNLDQQENDIVHQVVVQYGLLSGIDLSSMTHQDGSPWQITWAQNGQNAVIPNDLIHQHYLRLVNGHNTAAR